MKPIPPSRLPIYFALLWAGPALATSFEFTPHTNTFPFTWSVSIDGQGATANPDLEVMTGRSYSFTVTNVASHPFWIDKAFGIGGPLSDPYPTTAGLSDNGVGQDETITMNLPADAPDTLYYACGVHSSMIGTINVVHDLVFRGSFE